MIGGKALWKCLLVASMALMADGVTYTERGRARTFQRGDQVPLLANSLTSVHTLIPRDYYRLPFCRPEEGIRTASESLGERITGNKVHNSPYIVQMLEELYCQKLCQVRLSGAESLRLKNHIKHGYHNNWLLDDLPSANLAVSNGREMHHYAGGFPLGIMSNDKTRAYVYNHVNIVIDYHPQEDGYSIVGFAVEPLSVAHKFDRGYRWDGLSMEGLRKSLVTCPSRASAQHMNRERIESLQQVRPNEDILYTYDVIWRESDVAWSTRWDVYLTEDHLVPNQVHWYTIFNSFAVAIWLSSIVTAILVRNLKRDISAFKGPAAPSGSPEPVEEPDTEEYDNSEQGWIALHGDVFRPPQMPLFYCAFVGSGVHLALAALLFLTSCATGQATFAKRGSLTTSILFSYLVSGFPGGYVSGRLFKSFDGLDPKSCAAWTVGLFPGVVAVVFIIFNVLLWFGHATACVSFFDIVAVVALWCLIAFPLAHWGWNSGYHNADAIEFPTSTNPIPRAIPPSPCRCSGNQSCLESEWFGLLFTGVSPWASANSPTLNMVLMGIVTFAVVYVELFFSLTSLWMDQFYVAFGFALIVYIILIITSIEVTLLAVYHRLNAENHKWWWPAFFWSGSAAFYIFGYSVLWFRTLQAANMFVEYILYFGYMAVVSFAAFLLLGSLGSLASLLFVIELFSTVQPQTDGSYMELLDRDEEGQE